MKVIIHDIASLRYHWNTERSAVTMTSSEGELLSRVDVVAGCSEREAAFLAMDAALSSARLRGEDGSFYSLGLYNPYTTQVAVGSVPRTMVYSDGEPLPVEPSGLRSEVSNGMLWAGERVLSSLTPDPKSILTAVAAHRA